MNMPVKRIRDRTPNRIKVCTDCGVEFPYASEALNGKSRCIDCMDIRKQLSVYISSINATKHHFSLTVAQLLFLYVSHENRCGLCDFSPRREKIFNAKQALEIDHDHKHCPSKLVCGKCIRGLLCSNCNVMVGRYELCKGRLTIPVFDEYLALPYVEFPK